MIHTPQPTQFCVETWILNLRLASLAPLYAGEGSFNVNSTLFSAAIFCAVATSSSSIKNERIVA